jgi:hypothetical protein
LGVPVKEQKRMEPQSNTPEPPPMLIAVPQLWASLTPEHHHRFLQTLILICQELLRPSQVGLESEALHD